MAAKRLSSSHLARVLRDATRPLCVFDAQGQIVFANASLSAFLNCPNEELLGLSASFQSGASADVTEPANRGAGTEAPGIQAQRIANALCPPPQAFAGEQLSLDLVIPVWRSEGGASARPSREVCATFLPLAVEGSDNAHGGVIALLSDASGTSSFGSSMVTAAKVRNVQGAGHPEWASLHFALQAAQSRRDRQLGAFPLHGVSPAIARIVRQVEMLAPTATAASIVGPNGAPRQALAEFLHHRSPEKKRGGFLALDCRLADWEQLQDSVFSFLAAGEQAKDKRIDTVFVDGIDALQAAAQVAVAQFIVRLAEGVRIIAAVESSIQVLAARGEFDRQLAALLSPAVLEIPPLAQRREDIPLTVQACVEALNSQFGPPQKSGCANDALDDLCLAPWPGDVEQLQATVAEAYQQAGGPQITRADLPNTFRQRLTAQGESARASQEPMDLEAHLAKIETDLIGRALLQAKGNKTKAAELLGMTRPRFYRRLEQLGLSEDVE